MAAKSLRCVAIAYQTCNVDEVPIDEEQLAQWILPEDGLILLAILGIKVLTLNHAFAAKNKNKGTCSLRSCSWDVYSFLNIVLFPSQLKFVS